MNKQIILIWAVLGLWLTAAAQTVYPPFLFCASNSGSNGDIDLVWGNPTNNTCGTFVQYTIYASKNGPGGPYTAIAVTNQAATSYTLSGYTNISSTWYFYMTSTYNCPGATVISSDTIANQPPNTPQIVDVTVNANNQAIINFAPSSSPQTTHYIVYYALGSGSSANAWGTSYGINDTSVTNTDTAVNRNPSLYSQNFTVAAVDSCGNRSSFNTSPQHTILLKSAGSECQQQINFTWNSYANWPSGVLQYEVWVSRNEGPFTEVATTDTSVLNYAYTSFNTGDSLQVYILALSAADTNIVSRSNTLRFKASIVQPPSYINITNVTVNPANQIGITWIIDSTAQLVFYELQQSVDSIDYSPVEQISVPVPLTHTETYLDSVGVYPQNNPYYYEIDAFDSCQNQYFSNYAKTICLKGILYDYFVARLTWNSFELPNATVVNYNLYRSFGISGFQLIGTFPPNVTEHFDSLQQFLNQNGTFCYYVEATYTLNIPSPANYQATLTSTSNQSCVVHRPVIYVPNAFSPGSPVAENSVFKPTIIYGSPTGYSMLIFNRWGGKIFESNNPETGWDGTDHGSPAETGGYAYLINFVADDGTAVERKGIVLLVR